MTAQALIQQVTDTLYAPFRYSGAGLPESVQVSEPGWIYRDTNNGLLWYKKTGSAATGWKAMGGVISLDTTTTGNVGTGEDTLQTYTLPGGLLKDDGDSIRITVGGTAASNGNSKTIKVKFGGTIAFRVDNTSGSAIYWSITGTIVRTAAATQKAIFSYTDGITVDSPSGGSMVYYAAPAITTSSDVTVLVTGEATANNDIVKQVFQVELLPAP